METVNTVKILYTLENYGLKIFVRSMYTLEAGKNILCPFDIFPWHDFQSLDTYLSYFLYIKIKTTII